MSPVAATAIEAVARPIVINPEACPVVIVTTVATTVMTEAAMAMIVVDTAAAEVEVIVATEVATDAKKHPWRCPRLDLLLLTSATSATAVAHRTSVSTSRTEDVTSPAPIFSLIATAGLAASPMSRLPIVTAC
jgi:hypothetical protein